MTDDLTAVFQDVYAAPASRVQSEVFAAAMGQEYPAQLDTYSWISRTELADLSRALDVGPSDLLVDLGCGRGGPGLWIAAETGCDLLGLDISENAVADARGRVDALGLTGRAGFRTGSFERTGLEDASVDAVMSVDAFLFTPDKPAAAVELARVLRPGGRLGMTSWDYHRQPENRPPQVPDHRPLLEAAGFEVLRYDETDDWRGRQERSVAGFLARVEEMAAEVDVPVAEMRSGLEEMRATFDCIIRRFLLVAQRREG